MTDRTVGERYENPPIIDVENLTISFGDSAVLEDVSFSVDRGTIVGLIGPNGAGKTTLLRAISGVLDPDRGTVTVDGSDVHTLSSRETSQRVSVVPQDTTLSFAFDVRDVVEMGRTPYRSRFSPSTYRDRAIVDRALERTAITRFADRSIDDVSGGERQRVILARTLAQDTPVILLDEPTASLDVNHQIEKLELVSDLTTEGKTVVAAIHDLDLAARYCDELVLLADGGVLERGLPESVLTTAHLEQAFDARTVITTNPVTDSPTVTTLATESLEENESDTVPSRVHVVGSGPTAAGVLTRLRAAGIPVSLGPVTDEDVAAVTATRLGVETVTVDPFERLDPTTHSAVENRTRDADVTVLANLRVSDGNQGLLETLAGLPALVVVETSPFSDRNTAGDGARGQYEVIGRRALDTDVESICRAVCDAMDLDRNGTRGRTLESEPGPASETAESDD